MRKVLFDQSYDYLAKTALGLINSDRARYGAKPVTLSPVSCGQQHANTMFAFDYFSHWNHLGYKPYMRYTRMGGLGSMSENVAWQKLTPAPRGPYSLDEVVRAIEQLEYDMMYNDTEWGNGHRDNILNPHHNRVSVGIAHGKRLGEMGIYFVEDFEDYYIELETPFYIEGLVRLVGRKLKPLRLANVVVFRDGATRPINKKALDRSRSYNPGMLVGGFVPPMSNMFFEGVTTAKAAVWVDNQESIRVEFSLKPLVDHFGPGVYTIYLRGRENGETFTSLSIFNPKP